MTKPNQTAISEAEMEDSTIKTHDGEFTIEDIENNSKQEKILFSGFGVVSAILSAIFFSLSSIIVKMLDLHPTQLSLSRCFVQFLILLPIIQYKHKEVDVMGPDGMKVLLWVRGFVGSTAMILLYFTISELSVGNAVTISYLNMIMVPFIARIVLKESLTIFDIIFAVVALIGVVLIARPTFIFPPEEGEEIQSTIGIIYGVLCASFIAASITIIRKLGHTYAPLNVTYYSFCGAVITTVLLLVNGEFRYPCMSDLPFVFLIGGIGLLGQLFLTLALQYERAGTVCVLRSIQIIVVYVLQIIILGDIPSMLSIIGAFLVFSTSIGIGVRKLVNGKRRRNRKRSMAEERNLVQ